MANPVSNGGTHMMQLVNPILAMCEEISPSKLVICKTRSNKLVNEGNEKIVETCKSKNEKIKNTIESHKTIQRIQQLPAKDTVVENDKESR